MQKKKKKKESESKKMQKKPSGAKDIVNWLKISDHQYQKK